MVRLLANSEHLLCVSTPRCLRRTSWKVTSSCQRIANYRSISSGSASRSVHTNAWGLNSPCGSRTRTQRTGTAGKPVEYQTVVLEETSTIRCLLSYHLAIVVGFQTVFVASATSERLGSRLPFMRGLPILMGALWRSRFVEGSIQAQACDQGDQIGELAAAIEELQGSISAIGDGHYLLPWVPAPFQQEQLPGPLLG